MITDMLILFSIPKYDSQNIYSSAAYDEAGDIEHRQKVIQSTVQTIQKRLVDFHSLLLGPPKVNFIILYLHNS